MAETRIGGAFVSFYAKNRRFLRGSAQNIRALDRQRRAVRRTGSAIGVFNNRALQAVRALSLFGAGAGLLQGTSNLAQFEQAMASVRGVTQATANEFERLLETAQRLGRTTRFTATEVASGMLFLGRTGFEVNEVLRTIEPSLRLAQLAVIDLSQAADISSNVLKAFSLDASRLSRVVDILARTTTSSNTNLIQLGDAMRYVGPLANQLDLDVAEAAAAIGILSDAGLQGALAGTSLRQGLADLSRLTPTASKALARLGLTAQDVNVRFSSLVTVLERIRDSGANIDDLFEIFEVRSASGIAVLLDNIERLKELELGLRSSAGAARELARLQDETLTGASLKLKSAFQGLIIEIDDIYDITGKLRRLFEVIADGINRFTANLRSNAARLEYIFSVLTTQFVIFSGISRILRRFGALVANAFLGIRTGAQDLSKSLGRVTRQASALGEKGQQAAVVLAALQQNAVALAAGSGVLVAVFRTFGRILGRLTILFTVVEGFIFLYRWGGRVLERMRALNLTFGELVHNLTTRLLSGLGQFILVGIPQLLVKLFSLLGQGLSAAFDTLFTRVDFARVLEALLNNIFTRILVGLARGLAGVALSLVSALSGMVLLVEATVRAAVEAILYAFGQLVPRVSAVILSILAGIGDVIQVASLLASGNTLQAAFKFSGAWTRALKRVEEAGERTSEGLGEAFSDRFTEAFRRRQQETAGILEAQRRVIESVLGGVSDEITQKTNKALGTWDEFVQHFAERWEFLTNLFPFDLSLRPLEEAVRVSQSLLNYPAIRRSEGLIDILPPDGNLVEARLERISDILLRLNEAGQQVRQTLSGAFDRLITRSASLGEVLKDVVRELIRIYLQAKLIQPLLNRLLNANTFPGLFNLAQSPGTFARGGLASGLSIVGERGPELVDFRTPARVYSNEDSRGLLGGTVTFAPTINGNDPAAMRQAIRAEYPNFVALIQSVNSEERANQVRGN